uniref:Transmembrane protein 126A n=1 Tax=Sphenodon punctatus TaxID=8508 RepID=A0A8D0HA52_SPHPU
MAGRELLEPPSSLEKPKAGKFNKIEILQQMFERLPVADQNFFNHGPYALAFNGSLCGVIANSFFRRILNISQAAFASTLPMAVIPFITTFVAYQGLVNQPLLSGDLNCATCAMVRAGLVGSIAGCAYPAVLALPLNIGLATRYSKTPLPGKETAVRFWITVSRPLFKKISFIAVLQAVLGIYLGSRQHEIYVKMLQLPGLSHDPEELKE